MPTEFGRLVFRGEELLDALGHELKQTKGQLATARIVGHAVICEPELTVRVEIEVGAADEPYRIDGERRMSVTLEPAFVASALIRYCIREGIPMARRAEKSLQLVGDNLALSLSLGAPKRDLAELELHETG
jgi:hypothetical protein